MRVDGQRANPRAAPLEDGIQYAAAFGRFFRVAQLTAGAEARAAGGASGQAGCHVTAPVHGSLLEVCAGVGGSVEPGSRLAGLEAMMMQHEIPAGVADKVVSLPVGSACEVRAGALLGEIAPSGRGRHGWPPPLPQGLRRLRVTLGVRPLRRAPFDWQTGWQAGGQAGWLGAGRWAGRGRHSSSPFCFTCSIVAGSIQAARRGGPDEYSLHHVRSAAL
ncbi:acetyl-CoA carboxylase biotin carboxyl carrier protein subunit [Cribrihabitans pelagius]|uniref:acetyl-CoA carboxylase biotin carboxyl carrier protein subunit n=1 Tax=Cribrihabitans pelagius TaxID=1765746 RepID=UPI003B5B3020